MITYEALYSTLDRHGITIYQLLRDKVIGGGTLNNIRASKPISTKTINDLCNHLKCKPTDIITYTRDTSPGE